MESVHNMKNRLAQHGEFRSWTKSQFLYLLYKILCVPGRACEVYGILESDIMRERKVEDGGSRFQWNLGTYLLIPWRHVPEGRSLSYIL